MTLGEIESNWRRCPSEIQKSYLRQLAGLEFVNSGCKHCGSNHSVEWFYALCEEQDLKTLAGWLETKDGPRYRLVTLNPELEAAFRLHLEARLDCGQGSGPRRDGQFRDLFEEYASCTGTQMQGPRAKSGWAVMIGVFAEDLAPDMQDAVAAEVRLQTVNTGSHQIYPLVCQSFVLWEPEDFGLSPANVAALISWAAWGDVDFRWSIERADKKPLERLRGRSLDLCWALLGTNLYLRESQNGCCQLGGERSLCEVSLEQVAASAEVEDDGRLTAVSAETIGLKRRAAKDKGARVFVVAKDQDNLAGDESGIETIRCQSVYEAFDAVYRRQAESVLEWMARRWAAAQFCCFGCPEFVWLMILLAFLGWVSIPSDWFLLLPAGCAVLSIACWPWLVKRTKSRSWPAFLLPVESTRTGAVWARMVETVARRIEVEGRGLPRFTTLSLCQWLADSLQAVPLEGHGRFRREDWHGKLLGLLPVAAEPGGRPLRLRASMASLAALVCAVALLLIPQAGSYLAELLPPWGSPEIRGGYATRRDVTGQRYSPFEPAAERPWRTFVTTVGLQGEMKVLTDEKYRTRRLLRLHCDGCTVWTKGDESPAPTAPVVDGAADFEYFVPANADATLSIELVSSQGAPMHFVTVKLKRQ